MENVSVLYTAGNAVKYKRSGMRRGETCCLGYRNLSLIRMKRKKSDVKEENYICKKSPILLVSEENSLFAYTPKFLSTFLIEPF